jgi:hypothetical protein
MSLQAAKVTYFFYITDCFIKKLFFMAPQNNISPFPQTTLRESKKVFTFAADFGVAIPLYGRVMKRESGGNPGQTPLL